MKLAEALLLRKELQTKVDRLKAIDNATLFEFRMERKPATDGVDDIKANVPRVSFQQLTHCFDWHSKQLRLVDAAIQQANWTTELDIKAGSDYVDPYVKD